MSARGDFERERDDRELKLAERDRDDADAERDRRRGDGDRRGFLRGERERDLETIMFSSLHNDPLGYFRIRVSSDPSACNGTY